MVLAEIVTRSIDYLPPHELEHAVELERQARAARLPRRWKSAIKPHAAMSATGKPVEPPFDVALI
jgi:hypothetical protein